MHPTGRNKKQRSLALVTGLLVFASAEVSLAQCRPGNENPDIVASTPESDFEDGMDGTVLHVPTGLIWQRCALGQTWTGSTCTGSAQQYSWEAALQTADVQNGQSDWRVPNRNELSALVEDRCFGPALNELVFPEAPGGETWTSSTVTGQPGQAWSVDFDGGAVQAASISDAKTVRLVREPQP